jgi:aspartyl/glutamyl-tRNA(Asn/Gln) amidotransferase C subunit
LTEEPEGNGVNDEITVERLRHLHKLAQLNIPENAKQVTELKEDINGIAHFMKQVQKADIPANTEPLASLWQDQVGQTLRPDVPTHTEGEVRGRELLKLAKKTSGHFYVARANQALSEQ